MSEGVELDFSSLKSEWKQGRSEQPEAASFLPLLNIESDESQPNRQQNDPEPTIPVISPIEGTEISSWLAGSNLYIAVPEELSHTITPAIYKGSQAFPLKRTHWSEDVLKQLTGHKSYRLFAAENRNHLKVLTETRDSHIIDAGINQITYC
jgi:hypothetical protein